MALKGGRGVNTILTQSMCLPITACNKKSMAQTSIEEKLRMTVEEGTLFSVLSDKMCTLYLLTTAEALR